MIPKVEGCIEGEDRAFDFLTVAYRRSSSVAFREAFLFISLSLSFSPCLLCPASLSLSLCGVALSLSPVSPFSLSLSMLLLRYLC